MVLTKLNPGDYVRLELAKKQIEGIVLESYDKNVVLLKLASGYNIGINKENVFGVRVLRKFKEEEKEELDIKKEKGKKTIGLIVTGGTIASKLDSRTGGVKPLTSVSEFKRFYPKLFEKVNVKIEVPFMVASEDMDFSYWRKIAEIAEKMLNDSEISGIIVTHGSDTLHYTAAVLSFFLRNLNKPVILTFSQRSIDRASSDAELNLDCAVQMALSDCAEVVIVGHASTDDEFCFALRGTKVRKMHTSRRDTFKAVNTGVLAKVRPDRVEFLETRRPRNKERVELDLSFNDKIALVKFYPGQDAEILEHYFKSGFKGVVVEMTGLGHVNSNWISKLKRLIKSGFIVCATAQTIFGRLNPKVYSTGRELEKAGVIFLEDMLSETALVKLGFVLGHKNWRGVEKVREKMLENFSFEISEILRE